MAQLDKHTPYRIMFGPDVCGSSNRVHVIIADTSGQIFPLRQPKPAPVDHLTHVYTLAMYPNNTFKVSNHRLYSASCGCTCDPGHVWHQLPLIMNVNGILSQGPRKAAL